MTLTVSDHYTELWTPAEADPHPRVHRKGRLVPHGTVSVAPGTAFANPFDDPTMTAEQRIGSTMRYAVTLAGRPDRLADIAALSGRDMSCTCSPGDPGCHRGVLLDLANPPQSLYAAAGRAMGLTLRRPWASLLLVPETLSGKTIENRTWSTDYRGPVLIYGGTRIDDAGVAAAKRAGLNAEWHTRQQGWLGGAVLVDVHRSRGCCRPWGQPKVRADVPVYHWVFTHPHRLTDRTWGRGFVGLRPTSWSVLVRRSLLNPTAKEGGHVR